MVLLCLFLSLDSWCMTLVSVIWSYLIAIFIIALLIWSVSIGRAIWTGSNPQFECHEPSTTPVACFVLICKSPSEYMPEDVGRKTRECEGRSGHSSGAGESQLSCAAREIHWRGWIRGVQERNVCEGIYLLSWTTKSNHLYRSRLLLWALCYG